MKYYELNSVKKICDHLNFMFLIDLKYKKNIEYDVNLSQP